MRLDLVAPCVNCPFRRDVPGYLRPERAASICRSLTHQDQSFQCHKTITVDHETQVDEEDETFRPILDDSKSQFCAGALILLEKLGHPNRLPRIAMSFGIWDPAKMRNKDVVFDSPEEMIEHMKAGSG